ncbi:MAG: hypothetical protein LIO46_00295, partial [Clostridiales bacterium]|nr:hypothetical protein [Clostridiales bacterium]
MVIRQMNDIFTAMLRHGMTKTELPFETLYTVMEGYGSGYAKTTDRLDWWYYLDMNFYNKAAYALEYHIEEPHIVIGITDEIVFEYERQPDTSSHP